MKTVCWVCFLLSLLFSLPVRSQIPASIPLGLSHDQICNLTGVPVGPSGYAPVTHMHRMQLYLRCESSFDLLPGQALGPGGSCCAHLQVGEGGIFCPDVDPPASLVKNYIRSPLFPHC